MKFTQRTILGLFDSSKKQLVIPVYQRAYSWEMFDMKLMKMENIVMNLKRTILTV